MVRVSTRVVRIFLFGLYVLCYYVSAYFNYRIFDIEYVAIALIFGFVLTIKKGVIASSQYRYFANTKSIFLMSLVLLFISLLFQLVHFHLFTPTLKSLFYLVVPPILVCFVCGDDLLNIESLFDIVLSFGVVYFIIRYRASFNLRALSTISFMDSYSPFEAATTSITDIFFYCLVYYAHKKKYWKMGIAFFFGFLSFKRLIVVGMLIVIGLVVISNFSKKFKSDTGWKQKSMYVPDYYEWLLIGVICLAPLLVNLILSDGFAYYIEGIFGLDVNFLVKGRFTLLNYIIDTQPTNYGLGTIPYYMQTETVGFVRQARNLHNDLFRLYYETTIVGLFVFARCLTKNATLEKKAFYLTAFFLVNLFVSNTLTNFMPVLLFHLLICEFQTSAIYQSDME